jgi:hypothetical protein
MLRWTVSFRITPGKQPAAMSYLGELTRHLHSLTGAKYDILTRLGGPVGQVIIVTEFADAAAWEAGGAKVGVDATFQKLVAGAAEGSLFISGTTESALWRVN